MPDNAAKQRWPDKDVIRFQIYTLTNYVVKGEKETRQGASLIRSPSVPFCLL